MSRLPLSLRQPDSVTSGAHALPEMAAKAAPATFGHAMTAYTLLNNRTARLLKNQVFTAGLASRLMDPQIWGESQQLQSAVVQRLQQQNQDWLKGCAILMQDYAQIKQANTMTKLIEKQCNLVLQWNLLLTNQATNLLGLMENIEVDYGYWASQKLHA